MNPVDFFLRVRLDPRGRAHHVFILNPQHGSWVLGLGPPGATGSWVLEPARGLGLGSWVLGPPEAGFFGSETTKKRKIAVFFLSFSAPKNYQADLIFSAILVRIGVGQRCWFGGESPIFRLQH